MIPPPVYHWPSNTLYRLRICSQDPRRSRQRKRSQSSYGIFAKIVPSWGPVIPGGLHLNPTLTLVLSHPSFFLSFTLTNRTMPAVRTRLLGWSSGSNDPNVDAPLPQRSFPNFFSFKTNHDDDSLDTETHDSSRHTTTPTRTATPSTPPTIPPTNFSPSTPSSGSTDPAHVRRPRNSFIIFRCKYSREHTKSQLPDTPVVNDTIAAKSLSKRASEAWSKLTQEEKKVYEDMASLEKEEHARKNPDYRFKPKKRQQDSKRRKPRRIPSLVGLRRRMTSTSPQQSQGNSVASSPTGSFSSLLPTIHAQQPLPTPIQFDTTPKVVDPAVKAARRRSASAPQPYKPVALPSLPQIEGLDIHQRSRSIVARPIAVPHSRADYTRFGYPPLGAIPRPIPPPSLSSPDLSFGYDPVPFFRSDSQVCPTRS